MDKFSELTCDGVLVPGKSLITKFNYLVSKGVYTNFDKCRSYCYEGWWYHSNCKIHHDFELDADECHIYKLLTNNNKSRLGFLGGNIYQPKKDKSKTK